VATQDHVVCRGGQRRFGRVRHDESRLWGLGSCPLDHLGGEVDPVHGIPLLGQESADGARAAAEIGDQRRRRRQGGAQEVTPGGPDSGVAEAMVGFLVEVLRLGIPALLIHASRIPGHARVSSGGVFPVFGGKAGHKPPLDVESAAGAGFGRVWGGMAAHSWSPGRPPVTAISVNIT
jgi:hypothetical protein